MTWYVVKTGRISYFKDFVKKKFKKCKTWLPPKELFEKCIFFQTSEDISICSEFRPQKLTPDLYRGLTEKDIQLVGLKLEDKQKIAIGKRVKIVSPLVNFNGKVVKTSNNLIFIKGKVFNKVVKLAIPREYIEK